MNQDEQLKKIEESGTFLSQFEQQALEGEIRLFLGDLIEALEKNNYMDFVKEKNVDYQKTALNIAFVLYTFVDLIKSEDEHNLEPLASSEIIEILNPNLKTPEEKTSFVNKLFEDIKDKI